MTGTVNFDGADTSPLPSPFGAATGWGSLRRVSNQCANAAGTNDDAAMRRTDSTATRSILEYRAGTFDGGAALLDSAGNGYLGTSYNNDNIELYKVTAGPNYSRLGGTPVAMTITVGSIYELKIDGNDIVYLKDNVEITRETDTTFRTGLTPSVFIFAGDLRIDNHSDGAAGSQDITVGLASETDTAFSVGKAKSLVVGLALETDSVLTAGSGHQLTVTLPEETDTAFSVGKSKAMAVGLATETDTAQSVTLSGSLPTSYSTNFPLTENPINEGGMWRTGSVTGFYKNPRSTPGKCFAADFVGAGFDDCLGQLQNHAIPVNHQIKIVIFREPGYTAGDTHEIGVYAHLVIGDEFVRGYEFIFSGGIQVVRWEGISQDTDNFYLNLDVAGAGPGVLNTGDEITVTVQVVGPDVNFEVFKNGISVASLTDDVWTDGNPGMGFFVRDNGTTPTSYCISSWSVSAITSDVVVGLASETDSAFSVGKTKTLVVGLNTETDTAQTVAHTKTLTVGLALESDTALAATPMRTIGIGLATETDSTFAVAAFKSRVVGLALEVDGTFGVIGGQETGGGQSARRLGLGLGLG